MSASLKRSGTRCSSRVNSGVFWSLCDGSSDRSFMMGPLSYFSFQPLLLLLLFIVVIIINSIIITFFKYENQQTALLNTCILVLFDTITITSFTCTLYLNTTTHRAECLTCTFRANCGSARLFRAQVPVSGTGKKGGVGSKGKPPALAGTRDRNR